MANDIYIKEAKNILCHCVDNLLIDLGWEKQRQLKIHIENAVDISDLRHCRDMIFKEHEVLMKRMKVQ